MDQEEKTIFTESALSEGIKDFFKTFKMNEKYVYLDKVDELITKDFFSFEPKDLFQYKFKEGVDLYVYFMENSLDFIIAIKRAIKELFQQAHGTPKKFELIIYDVDKLITVTQALGNEFINNIVTLKGIITSRTTIFNLPDQRYYVCPSGHLTKSKEKPTVCNNPDCKFRLDDLNEKIDKNSFSRHRLCYLKYEDDDGLNQEDELKIDLINSLCDLVNIGDRVKVTGIIETQDQGKKKNYLNTLSVLGIQKLDDVDLTITSDDEKEFKEYPELDDFYSRLIHSIAPSIYGWLNVKESILLQLIGSPQRIKKDGTKVRGEIHLGLFGDPGTAKTKFGEWVTNTFPRCKLVMGKGATSTGLTMGLEDGPDGRKILRSGAMVNCRNGGTVVLDEFPRTDKEVIDGLYTIVEDGYASISKTGFQTKVKANANLILTGNAHDGRWSDNLTISDNLSVDTTFLTRIDYNWIFIDEYNEKTDLLLSDAVLNDVEYEDEVKPFSPLTLQKYLKHCKKLSPQIPKEVKQYLQKAYLELRKDPQAKENGITLRHLETMMRSTKAIARLYQREFCSVEDADKTIRLISEMFKQQNISIAQAGTYIQRNLNKAVNILFDESIDGLEVKDLFDKILQYGTIEDKEQARVDLGDERNHTKNKKWRNVIEAMKRSPRLVINSRHPLIFAYDHSKGDLRNY